ncbi:trypsin-like peptidase domain-containing protein [Actinomyces sp. zg-332]|uniref:S1C family serine protease n=1 Tax=Actinomyces sp. zg-332 TaxID=2708340 RepID=UPI001423148F|nr:trypsin-like peptidase domain-containing protein [Actinomyces sp. zg-332]QPK94025.1 trypsin-like peptidase domain-containing protein [Actinomyces sp. zg-332]
MNEADREQNRDKNGFHRTEYGFMTKNNSSENNETHYSSYSKAEKPNTQAYYTEFGFITFKNQETDTTTKLESNDANQIGNNNISVESISEDALSAQDSNTAENPFSKQARKSHRKDAKKTSRRKPGWIAVITIALICGLLPSGYIAYNIANPHPVVLENHTKNNSGSVKDIKPSQAPDWKQVAKAVQASVVAIKIKSQSGSIDGSGVVIDKKGHIVTNYHVISNAIRGKLPITVQMQGGVLYEAEIVGYDSSTDLAVIKLKNTPENITPAVLGSSQDLEVGSPVLAIGNPLGLDSTVTTGIISALNRPVKVSVDTPDQEAELVVTNAIQVDASINPGNSGGPLFDSSGKVIGINSSIATTPRQTNETQGSIGLGFAIPVDLVKNVVEQIINTGKAEHPLLGVTITNGEGTVKDKRYIGAYVKSVVPNSPADKIGLQPGDMIVDIDGNRVISDASLRGYVRRYKKNDRATVTYLRDGKEMQGEVVFSHAQ